MSYDVGLVVPRGDAPLEEQVDADAGDPPYSDADLKRLARLRASLAAFDPTAVIEDRADGRLGFIVADAKGLPPIEAGPRTAGIHMAMGTDSHALYRALHEVLPLFYLQGYSAYDYQLGEMVTPADDFAGFMQQYRSQWSTDAAYRSWLSRDSDGPPTAAPAPPAASPRKGVNGVAIVFGMLFLIWAAWKLHKAGYF